MSLPDFQTIKNYSIAFVAYLLLRLLELSYRWDESHYLEATKELDEPQILVFWHNQQLLMQRVYNTGKSRLPPRKIFVMISEHGDGRLIAALMRFLHIDSVAGSSTRGGKRAFLKLLKLVRSGNHVVITPDGPRGPIYEVKDGAIKLAQLSGAPLLICAMAASNVWEFKSWDRMFLPKPFSKVAITSGQSFRVPADASESELEQYRLMLKQELDRATELAQSLARRG